MVGSWFAGTIEAPGELQSDAEGRIYKESWGMASTKAVQARFGRLDAYERARKELFAEESRRRRSTSTRCAQDSRISST